MYLGVIEGEMRASRTTLESISPSKKHDKRAACLGPAY